MKRTLSIASLVSFVLYAADPPTVKEGLWSVHTVSIDNPGSKKSDGTRSVCRNHAYDARILEQSAKQQKQTCKSVNRSSSGNSITDESECTVQGSVIKSKAVTTYTGDTMIHAETHGTYTPPLYGTTETNITVDQKYVGPCPAGMEPGDFMSADGKVTHVKRP